jgi:hypothetical protein
MFDIVKAIHEALHTESTWAFVLTVAIAGGLLCGGVAWIVDKGYRNALAERSEHQQPALPAAQPEPPAAQVDDKPPTLADLFKSGFTNTMKMSGSTWNLRSADGASVLSGQTQVYLDFPANIKFIAFFIPRSEHSFTAATQLWSQVQTTFDSVAQQIQVQVRGFGNSTDLKDLAFSGRVFIYHEDQFTLRQLADLLDLYKVKGMSLEFMGPDFLGAQVIAWHHKHDRKQSDWNIVK